MRSPVKIGISLILSTGLSLIATSQLQSYLYAGISDVLPATLASKPGGITIMGFYFATPAMGILFIAGIVIFTWFFLLMFSRIDS